MRDVKLVLSKKELEILYASFKRYLDTSTPVLVPENVTLDELNKLFEKHRKEINKVDLRE
jgi:hypothetical protein